MKITPFNPAMTLLLFAAVFSFPAGAGTVETFTFTQTYPVDVMTGTFTGSLEPDGSIQLADLTAFSAILVNSSIDTYSLQDLQLFSFLPGANGPNSSLDFFASITSGVPGSFCVGAAAAFGLCGQNGNIAGDVHFRYAPNPFLFETTTQFASVNLDPPAIAPEPSTLWLWGWGIALMAAGWLRRYFPARPASFSRRAVASSRNAGRG